MEQVDAAMSDLALRFDTTRWVATTTPGTAASGRTYAETLGAIADLAVRSLEVAGRSERLIGELLPTIRAAVTRVQEVAQASGDQASGASAGDFVSR